MKKVWQKPELVVLVRGKPEESVLAACKGGVFTGAVHDKVGCRSKVSGKCVGTQCLTVSPS